MKNAIVAASTEPSHTLAELQTALGEPDTDLDAAFFHGVPDAELITMGQKIATSRVLTDVRRIYPMAFDFWQHAGEPQRRTLRGFSLPLLALGVGRAIRLQELLAQQTARTGATGTTREGREREARDAFEAALLLRDQALPVLRAVVAGDHELSAEVESAVGTADSPENLAAAIQTLGSVGARLVAAKKGPLAARARLMQIDGDYVDTLNAAATRLSEATEKARARSGSAKITQGALDREDGANLRILGHVIDVFEAAHDIDPSIPRLAPIATRRLLGRTRRAVDTAAQGNGAAAPGGAASATPAAVPAASGLAAAQAAKPATP
jgi:hypothetical protein